MFDESLLSKIKPSQKNEDVVPGLLGAAISLSAIGVAIAALLPKTAAISDLFRALIAMMAGVMAVLSALSSILILTIYCGRTLYFIRNNYICIRDFAYIFLFSALIFWLVISLFIGIMAFAR